MIPCRTNVKLNDDENSLYTKALSTVGRYKLQYLITDSFLIISSMTAAENESKLLKSHGARG